MSSIVSPGIIIVDSYIETSNSEEGDLIIKLYILIISSHYEAYFNKRAKRTLTITRRDRITELLSSIYPR